MSEIFSPSFLSLLGETPETIEKHQEEKALVVENSKRAGAILKEYQDNIKASERDKSAILEGIDDGESPYTLFIKAVAILGRLTGDSIYKDIVEERSSYLYSVYSDDEDTLDALRLKTERRLVRLMEARKVSDNPRELRLIDRATRKHLDHLEEIEKKLSRLKNEKKDDFEG